MKTEEIYSELPHTLVAWYERSHRDLPWRQDREPYHIWLSEIMLQQTRVEAVKGYYTRFLERLPTIASLAQADDALVQKLWEGLGYYSRARNLKKAAQVIMERYGGVFPGEYEQVLSLPGIGEYTAGAICSIAFDQPTPAVDGNVLRLCARLTEDTTPVDLPAHKAALRAALAKVYPQQGGTFTQALMELGATVCGPNRKPDCVQCPCAAFCRGFQNGTVESVPVRLPKRARREEERTVFILRCGELYAVEKRENDAGLLAGLWQFPNCEGKLTLEQAMDWARSAELHPTQILRQVERKHIFTHIQWNMRGFYMEVAQPQGSFVWRTAQQIADDTALPTAFRLFFEPQMR